MEQPDDPSFAPLEGMALSRRDDEFSAQFSTPADPRFWIRIELPVGEEVQVTDLLPGSASERQAGAALAHALRALGAQRRSRMALRDLGPAGDPATREALARVERILDYYLAIERRFVASRQLETSRNKLALLLTFHALTP